MAPRRIFISHSANHDPQGRVVLDALVEALEGSRDGNGNPLFTALVDDAIPKGEKWRSILYGWMMTADAAVILLDESLVKSEWVPREAAILCCRQTVDARFVVFPVLRGVTFDLFNHPPLAGLEVQESNAIRFQGDVATIVVALKRQESFAESRRIERLAEKLQDYESHLRVIVDRLFHLLPPQAYRQGWKLVQESAAALLSYGLRRETLGDVEYPAAEAIHALCDATRDRGLARHLMEDLRSYWVDREAGGRLFLLRKDPRPIVIGLHIDEVEWMHDAVYDHLNLAYSESTKQFVLVRMFGVEPQDFLHEGLEELEMKLKTAVATKLKFEGWNSTVQRLYEQELKHIYCWVPLARVRFEDFIELQRRYPHLKIVGIGRDDGIRSDHRVNYLPPEIPPGAEETARLEIEDSMYMMESHT